jgi:DNA-binding GntR family transcriptional regulator
MSLPTLTTPAPIYQTMTEIATRLIRERVLSGHYQPGSRLIPAKIETELGLGRVAIREALRELTGSGMVVSLPNRGVTVAEAPSFEEISALYETRYALEGEAASLAARNMNPALIARLEALAIKMEKESKSPFDTVLQNREFHLILYEASGWKSACRIINQLIDQTMVFRSLHSTWWTDDPRGFFEDHRKIIAALKAGAYEDTKRLVVGNISRGYQQILSMKSLQKPPRRRKAREAASSRSPG